MFYRYWRGFFSEQNITCDILQIIYVYIFVGLHYIVNLKYGAIIY